MFDYICRLLCKSGIYEGRIFELSSGDFIGRADQCRIVLKDRMTSRLHCRVMYSPEGWMIICTGLNGMLINGKYFPANYEMIPLRRGSVIQINKDEFIVL